MCASVHVFRCGVVQEEAMRGRLRCLEIKLTYGGKLARIRALVL